VSITIIIEGGSSKSESVEKKGFTQLFAKVCPGQSPRVKLARGRSQAMKAFLDEVAQGKNAVLLVDSEGALQHDTGHAFLVATAADHGVPQIAGANVDDVHLMVQVMESWFFADPQGIKSVVRNLDTGSLINELATRNGNVELIPKKAAQQIFRQACNSRYEKVKHLEFVGRIDEVKLEAASRCAAALFRRLRGDTPVWP
jgi:uncharacterized protein YneR